MAQAETHNTPIAVRAATRDDLGAFNMEFDLSELAEMANLAVISVYSAIGETEIVDGEVTGHCLTARNISTAQFAVGHLVDMIEAIKAKYIGAPSSRH